MRGCSSARARFPSSDFSQSQALVDLRAQLSTSSSSSSEDRGLDGDNNAGHEVRRCAQTQSNGHGGEFGRNYGGPIGEVGNDHDQLDADNEVGNVPSAPAGNPPQTQNLLQRFGPDENYIVAIQVNADEPFTAKHGDVNRQWQSLADKLNGSPNFNMVPIKGTTAKARFKALLAKHRTWDASSAKMSGSDEQETAYILDMTELVAKAHEPEVAMAATAAANTDEQAVKEKSGEVVRQAAVSRIQLGKRTRIDEVAHMRISERTAKEFVDTVRRIAVDHYVQVFDCRVADNVSEETTLA